MEKKDFCPCPYMTYKYLDTLDPAYWPEETGAWLTGGEAGRETDGPHKCS